VSQSRLIFLISSSFAFQEKGGESRKLLKFFVFWLSVSRDQKFWQKMKIRLLSFFSLSHTFFTLLGGSSLAIDIRIKETPKEEIDHHHHHHHHASDRSHLSKLRGQRQADTVPVHRGRSSETFGKRRRPRRRRI
jgi:hypothetical protein